MRIFKKIIIILILFLFCSSIYLVRGGYEMYKNALKNESLDDVIYKIKSKDNYTKITDMPKMYLKAVISVEDHRFYKHKGIDLIAVSRALISDIKEMKYIEGGSTLYNTINKRHPTILNMPRSAARCGQSSVKGKQTDIQAIPAHIALGNPSRDTISIALETINVSFIYHTFLAERISNSRNRSKKVLRYGLFF